MLIWRLRLSSCALLRTGRSYSIFALLHFFFVIELDVLVSVVELFHEGLGYNEPFPQLCRRKIINLPQKSTTIFEKSRHCRLILSSVKEVLRTFKIRWSRLNASKIGLWVTFGDLLGSLLFFVFRDNEIISYLTHLDQSLLHFHLVIVFGRADLSKVLEGIWSVLWWRCLFVVIRIGLLRHPILMKTITFLSKSLAWCPETIGVIGGSCCFVIGYGALTGRWLHKLLILPSRILLIWQSWLIIVLRKLRGTSLLITSHLGGLHQVLNHCQIILTASEHFHEILPRHWLTCDSSCRMTTWCSLMRFISLSWVVWRTVVYRDVSIAVLALRPRKLAHFTLIGTSILRESITFIMVSPLVFLNMWNSTASRDRCILVLVASTHNSCVWIGFECTLGIRWALWPPSIISIMFLIMRGIRLSLDMQAWSSSVTLWTKLIR